MLKKSAFAVFAAAVFALVLIAGAEAPGDASGDYELLTANLGSGQVTIYDKDRVERWTYDGVSPIDAWRLKNDEILIAYLPSRKTGGKGGVRIVSKDKKVVLDYPINDEVMSCVPMAGGNILFTECKKGVLSELTRDGKILRQITLKSKGMGHRTVRNIRITPQNTILAAECYSHVVREYDWAGKILNEFKLKMAYSSQRLANGNTLVAGYKPARVVEFNRDGKIVWEFDIGKLKSQGVDFGNNVPFGEARRLPCGNTLVTSYNRKNKVGQAVVVEVTPKMKLLRQWKATAKSKGAIAAKPLPLPKR
jgi:hypothetical protein